MNFIPFFIMAFHSLVATNLLNGCGITSLGGLLNEPGRYEPVYEIRNAKNHLPHMRCPSALHAEGSLAQAFVGTPKELPPLFSPSHYGAVSAGRF